MSFVDNLEPKKDLDLEIVFRGFNGKEEFFHSEIVPINTKNYYDSFEILAQDMEIKDSGGFLIEKVKINSYKLSFDIKKPKNMDKKNPYDYRLIGKLKNNRNELEEIEAVDQLMDDFRFDFYCRFIDYVDPEREDMDLKYISENL